MPRLTPFYFLYLEQFSIFTICRSETKMSFSEVESTADIFPRLFAATSIAGHKKKLKNAEVHVHTPPASFQDVNFG